MKKFFLIIFIILIIVFSFFLLRFYINRELIKQEKNIESQIIELVCYEIGEQSENASIYFLFKEDVRNGKYSYYFYIITINSRQYNVKVKRDCKKIYNIHIEDDLGSIKIEEQ